MTYEFLHHLTQVKLPVAIFDHRLIKQLRVYEDQALIVTVILTMTSNASIEKDNITQVTKITKAGRRAVRSYLKTR